MALQTLRGLRLQGSSVILDSLNPKPLILDSVDLQVHPMSGHADLEDSMLTGAMRETLFRRP